MMHIFHTWRSWSAIKVRDMVYVNFKTGERTPFIERYQSRECQKCGKIQENVL